MVGLPVQITMACDGDASASRPIAEVTDPPTRPANFFTERGTLNNVKYVGKSISLPSNRALNCL